MKKVQVIVPWEEGLHMRPASRLVRCASVCRSSIRIMAHGKVADARSILGILLLCASVGTLLDVEVSGEDEVSAMSAVEKIFESSDDRV
ncbi:MAG: HPr family phosphocarrier protein [Verrucomicrobia bacterium]|nr:MAG: HPr family phosphocarrier protein [Verrucomicrobiota bacterium]